MSSHGCCSIFPAPGSDSSSLRRGSPPSSFRPDYILKLLRTLKNRRTLRSLRSLVHYLAKFVPQESFSHSITQHLRCLLTPVLGLLSVMLRLRSHGVTRRQSFFVFIRSLEYLLSKKFCGYLHGPQKQIAFADDVVRTLKKWRGSGEKVLHRFVDEVVDNLNIIVLIDQLIRS